MSPATQSISVTDAVFGAVGDWSLPLLTYYDHSTGERTELSAATLGNWAAKTANFLIAELGVAPGDSILVDLPEHWQSAAIVLGVWWSGAQVRTPGSESGTDDPAAVITSADRIDDYPDAEELLVASLDPFALGVPNLPVGVTDFASAVRVHGDQFTPLGSYPGAALDGISSDDVIDGARTAAAEVNIGAGARVLSTRPWRDTSGLMSHLLAPLVVGASIVVVTHPDDQRIDDLIASERVTSRLG